MKLFRYKYLFFPRLNICLNRLYGRLFEYLRYVAPTTNKRARPTIATLEPEMFYSMTAKPNFMKKQDIEIIRKINLNTEGFFPRFFLIKHTLFTMNEN